MRFTGRKLFYCPSRAASVSTPKWLHSTKEQCCTSDLLIVPMLADGDGRPDWGVDCGQGDEWARVVRLQRLQGRIVDAEKHLATGCVCLLLSVRAYVRTGFVACVINGFVHFILAYFYLLESHISETQGGTCFVACFLLNMTLYLIIVKSVSHINLQPVIECKYCTGLRAPLLLLDVWTSFNLHTSFCLLAHNRIFCYFYILICIMPVYL